MMPELGLSQMQLAWLESAHSSSATPSCSSPAACSASASGRASRSWSSGWSPLPPCWRPPLAAGAVPGRHDAHRAADRAARPGACAGTDLPGLLPASSRPGSGPRDGRWCRACRAWACSLGAAVAPLAHRVAHVRVRLAAGAVLDHAAGARSSIVWWGWYARNTPAEHPRVSDRGTRRARRRRPQVARRSRSPGRAPGRCWQGPRRAAADRLVPLHELRLLPARELVLPLPGAGAALHGARERLPGRARHRWRPRSARAWAAMLASALSVRFGDPQGTADRSAAVAARRRPAAVPRGRCGERLRRRRGTGAVLRVRRAERGALLGGHHEPRAHRQHGRHRGYSIPAATSAASSGYPSSATSPSHHAWTSAFLLGTVLALVSAAAWLFVDPTRSTSRRRTPQPTSA